MVEFALVAPIFFLLLFAIIEAGRFIYHYEMLNDATRAGVRYAIIHGERGSPSTGPGSSDPTGNAVKQAVSDGALGLVGAGQLTFPPGYPAYSGPNGESNKRGSNVAVKVTFTYAPLLPVLPPITITAEATGVVNN